MNHKIVRDAQFTYLQTSMSNGLRTSTVLYKNDDLQAVKGSIIAELIGVLSSESKKFLTQAKWEYIPEYEGCNFDKVAAIKHLRKHIRKSNGDALGLLVAKRCCETFHELVYKPEQHGYSEGWKVHWTEVVDFLNKYQELVDAEYLERDRFESILREIQKDRNGYTTC